MSKKKDARKIESPHSIGIARVSKVAYLLEKYMELQTLSNADVCVKSPNNICKDLMALQILPGWAYHRLCKEIPSDY